MPDEGAGMQTDQEQPERGDDPVAIARQAKAEGRVRDWREAKAERGASTVCINHRWMPLYHRKALGCLDCGLGYQTWANEQIAQLRADLDLTKAKNEEVAASAAALKQMGMAEVVSIVCPDKKLIYILFPGVQSCLEMPIPKEESNAIEKNTKVTKTPLGKESVGGHSCVKNKVVVNGDKGPLLEATTWNATDLKDFPVQIESREKENISVIHFKDVQLSKPDATKFEVPANYVRYTNQQDLMMGIARKAMSGGK